MYRVIRGKQNKKKPLNPIGMVLFVTGCNIARMNNLRWLHITGTPPRLVNNAWSNENEPSEDDDVDVKEMRLLVRAYSEAATRRWFEVISRSIAGINYVKYLRGHFKSVISRHILAFCSRSDASHLVLYDLPYDKELWKGFFSSLNSQSTLRVLDFTNMKLTSEQLTFSEMLFAGLKLDRLDYSFNNIDLTVASRGVFNSLMPRMLCSVYNISDNPLGDCKLSADLFVELCLKAEAVKVCMNRCKLGDYFLSSVVKALSRSNPYQGIIKLEVLELEGNSFSSGSLHEFVSYVSEFFPTLATIRLHGSVTTSSVTESTFNGHQILTLDAFSPTEPRHGKFTRIKYLQKPKRTTRDTINKLLEGGVSQALSLRYSR
ncbi:hypothetical protein BaOVIS_025700 [Babesia ovis]|uniref:Uncharacterized protein n=1 Tax=Babesia ovis TaxID=5869 RepID=A0A9W5WVP6_BABOV|nr:hypothetical protein BaOVIS_025700 [Babesia ovis]